MNHDIIIVGGGIAGLYTCYKALKKNANRSILLFEKEHRLGGRIYTYHKKDFPTSIEMGAGRFHHGHFKLIKLIHDLGLSHLMIPIHNLEEHEYMKYLLDIIIQKYHAKKTDNFLGLSFHDYVIKMKWIDQEQMKYILDNYGYSAELHCMNMKDAMVLIEDMKTHKYYSLKGGFSQIIDYLEQNIKKMGGKIQLNANIQDVKKIGDQFLVSLGNKSYMTNTCVLAIPKTALLKLSLLKPIKNKLNSIVTTPLCRIYTTYSTPRNCPIWFHDLPKQTINNHLRIIIPLNEEHGVIMNAYTDAKYARWWYRIWKKEGLNAIRNKIHFYTKKSFPWSENQYPDKVKIAYWEEGVAFWKPGITNSEIISKEIERPFGLNVSLYICGENYSPKQQWMESALITSPIL